MATMVRVLILAWLFRASLAFCRRSYNCEDCVSKSSWNGASCRWCPRTNTCHAYGSWVNKCKRAENIVEKSVCGSKPSRYDPGLSYKMLLLSSVAYDKRDPQRCVEKVLRSSRVQVRKVVTRRCDSRGHDCSAYLAISDAERAIIVAFRGSESRSQAMGIGLGGVRKEKFLGGEVSEYWNRAFRILWGNMESDVKALRSKYPRYKIWVTGHSLGGAMASLASTWLAYYDIAPAKDIVLYTFGMPRVGNYDYALQHDRLVKNSWRVVNYKDPVPHLPPVVLNILGNGPYHHGVEAYYSPTATSVYSNHKECHGKPYNEDVGCSFTTPHSWRRQENHVTYFSIAVGTHCSSISRKKRHSSIAEFEFPEDHTAVYEYENGAYVLRQEDDASVGEEERIPTEDEPVLTENESPNAL